MRPGRRRWAARVGTVGPRHSVPAAQALRLPFCRWLDVAPAVGEEGEQEEWGRRGKDDDEHHPSFIVPCYVMRLLPPPLFNSPCSKIHALNFIFSPTGCSLPPLLSVI